MKKIIVGFLTLVAVAISAVLIGPSFVDWNAYKGDFSRIVRNATGRDLNIIGDISITVLPSPALIARDVHFANIEGASSPDMASLKSVEVRIKLGPLLSGNVVVESVHLIEPVIELEVLADGRSNMTFAAIESSNDDSGGGNSGSDSSDDVNGIEPSVSLENFVIDAGTVVYRDRVNGKIERIEGIHATIAAASLSGPFEMTGHMIARGVPLNVDVTVGAIIHGRTVTVAATLESALARARARINGTVTNLAEVPRLKGTLSASGENFAAGADAIAGISGLPGGLSQPFSAEGDVIADAGAVEISNLSFQIGDMQGTAVGSLQPGKNTSISAAVSINRLDLDKWVSLPPYQPTAPEIALTTTGVATLDGKKATARLDPASPPRPAEGPKEPATFAVPADIVGALDLNVGTINYRGGLIRQVRASVELSNGEITISQVAAQLPGSSDVALFGFISSVAGKPQFDGELEATASDLRRILDWLGVDLPPVPLDRLRKMTIKSELTATPDEVRISGLDMRLDSSRLTGGITVALRNRPAFGANLAIDRINLDSYMPGGDSTSSNVESKPVTGGKNAGATSGAGSPASAFQSLGEIDANLKLRVGSLTYQKSAISGVALDATLVNGTLEVRDASIADAAGSSIRIVGGVGPLTGVPSFKGLRVELKAPETSRLFRLLGTEPPIDPQRLGAVTFSGLFDGNVLSPTVDARLQAAGTDVTIKGNLSAFSTDAMIDADTTLRHGDLPRLLRTLGLAYQPTGPLGAVEFTGHVKAGPAGLNIVGIAARLAQSEIKGDVAVSLSGQRPRIVANLTSSDLVIDRFLPAQRAAMNRRGGHPIYDRPGIVPAAWPAALRMTRQTPIISAATTGGERWSREPLDLSALGTLDGNITLRSNAIAYQNYRLEEADIAASLTGGILRAEKITGRLFGGNFGGGLELDANGVPRLSSRFSLNGADLNAVMAAFNVKETTGGQLNSDFKAGASGRSVAEVVGALAGGGTFALLGVDVASRARGTPLSGLLGLLGGINQLSGTMSAGRGSGRADLTGTYIMERGIARSNDIRLASDLGNGQAAGTVNLPAWQIDMAGQIDLKQNLLAAYLTRNTSKVPTTLPFTVQGPLDAPNVRLGTAAPQGGGIPLPGVDKLIEKNPAAGQLLQQILPGLTSKPTPQQPTQQAPQPAPQPAKREDLLRGLLQGLTR